jgi:ribosome-binding factor A
VSRRTERVGEQIRAELARLLREEATDPRLRLVTLTRVDVSPDLRNARVYWSRMQASEAAEDAIIDTEEGLDSAAGFLRRRLAAALPLKRMPELRFRHDPSLALGDETLSLLREIRDGAPE